MRFLVDRMCGRLASWLRLLGYDAEFAPGGADVPGIIYASLRERRIILTRNTGISPKRAYGIYLVKSNDFFSQIKEVVAAFNLRPDEKKTFTRCISCNGEIKKIEKESVRASVPSFVFQTQSDFYACGKCGKIYWKGSHLELAKKLLDKL